MPAKKVIYSESIIQAAVEVIRKKGENSLNAREIARELGCSTQPLYSVFANMREIEEAVRQAVASILDEYMANEMKSGRYKDNQAIGMGYIRFAAEEKNLFRYLYMFRPIAVTEINVEFTKKSVGFIKERARLDEGEAQAYFGELWIFCHGIASLIAAERLDFDEEKTIEAMIDVACGLTMRYKEKNKKG